MDRTGVCVFNICKFVLVMLKHVSLKHVCISLFKFCQIYIRYISILKFCKIRIRYLTAHHCTSIQYPALITISDHT